ncbi:hypothetical protein AG1IA_00576 [Rhizoctonia solani AG-1 IA]|uniref:Uncharacterized protein n=1 Tax=Thanatephorus cucumeris (strain AG1-IA) TaxID=983506 RepID=L8X5B4_THACA|nr:hypothetical protein AG1IA_00576 [Rhizoctonia solani AG-1 IA]
MWGSYLSGNSTRPTSHESRPGLIRLPVRVVCALIWRIPLPTQPVPSGGARFEIHPGTEDRYWIIGTTTHGKHPVTSRSMVIFQWGNFHTANRRLTLAVAVARLARSLPGRAYGILPLDCRFEAESSKAGSTKPYSPSLDGNRR